MNKKLRPRELLLMTLPAVLLGGMAWWLGSGGQMGSPWAAMSRAVTNARRPSLAVQGVSAKWISPTQWAFIGNEKGCLVTVQVPASAFPGQARPAKVPSFITTDIVDDKGRSIKAILSRKRKFSSTTAYSGITTGTSWPSGLGTVPNTTYAVTATVPFAHLPKGTRSAVFTGTIGWGTATPVPVKFEVLPAWMRRPAKRLRIETVKWTPRSSGKGGFVEVTCRLTNPVNAYLFGLSEGATFHSERIGIGYDPKEFRWAKSSGKDDVLLAEWSQRIESGDGRLNSIGLLRTHMDKEMDRLHGGYLAPMAASFDPLCKPYGTIEKDKVQLSYDVSTIPQTFKNPVFRCEIYLVGDGMVNVKCPLK